MTDVRTLSALAELQSEESWIIVTYTIDDDGIHLHCERPDCGWTKVIGHNPTVEDVRNAAGEHTHAGHQSTDPVITRFGEARCMYRCQDQRQCALPVTHAGLHRPIDERRSPHDPC